MFNTQLQRSANLKTKKKQKKQNKTNLKIRNINTCKRNNSSNHIKKLPTKQISSKSTAYIGERTTFTLITCSKQEKYVYNLQQQQQQQKRN